MAAPAKKTYTSFPGLKKNIFINLSYKNKNNTISNFTCTIYPNPHKHISKSLSEKLSKIDNIHEKIHEDIHEKLKTAIKNIPEIHHILTLFGRRIQKDGKLCLGITEDIILTNILKHDYLALVHVTNDDIDDSATAALQYLNWCAAADDSKQFWIHELCRVNNSALKLKSPVSVLLDTLEQFSTAYSITDNYLLVEGEQPGTNTLISIYNNYGFKIDDSCKVEPYDHTLNNGTIIKTSAIAMKKSLIRHNAAAPNNAAPNNAPPNNVPPNNARNNGSAANQHMNNATAPISYNNIKSMNTSGGNRKRKTRKNKKK